MLFKIHVSLVGIFKIKIFKTNKTAKILTTTKHFDIFKNYPNVKPKPTV